MCGPADWPAVALMVPPVSDQPCTCQAGAGLLVCRSTGLAGGFVGSMAWVGDFIPAKLDHLALHRCCRFPHAAHCACIGVLRMPRTLAIADSKAGCSYCNHVHSLHHFSAPYLAGASECRVEVEGACFTEQVRATHLPARRLAAASRGRRGSTCLRGAICPSSSRLLLSGVTLQESFGRMHYLSFIRLRGGYRSDPIS